MTTSTFRDRLSATLEHERGVLLAARRDGWTACPFGQGLLDETVRAALRTIDTPLRFLPDIVAVRGPAAYLIDAKTETRFDTPNFAIQTDALVAGHSWSRFAALPLVFVWADYRCNFSWDLLANDAPLRRGHWTGNGSGTPFYLWPKTAARPFDSLFGPGADVYGAPPEWYMEQLRRKGNSDG